MLWGDLFWTTCSDWVCDWSVAEPVLRLVWDFVGPFREKGRRGEVRGERGEVRCGKAVEKEGDLGR